MTAGKLQVTAVTVRGLAEKGLTQSKPFLGCYVDPSEKHRTHAGEGPEPQWNQTLECNVSEGKTTLHVEVVNEDSSRPGVLGSGTVDLSPVFQQGRLEQWLPVAAQSGEPMGHVLLNLRFIGSEGSPAPGYPSQPPSYQGQPGYPQEKQPGYGSNPHQPPYGAERQQSYSSLGPEHPIPADYGSGGPPPFSPQEPMAYGQRGAGSPYGQSPAPGGSPYGQPPAPGGSPYGQPGAPGGSPYGQAPSPYGQPPAPGGSPYGQAPSPYGQPGAPGGSPYGQPPAPGGSPYGQPGAAASYGQPPADRSPYGQPGAAASYGQASAYGQPPTQPYGQTSPGVTNADGSPTTPGAKPKKAIPEWMKYGGAALAGAAAVGLGTWATHEIKENYEEAVQEGVDDRIKEEHEEERRHQSQHYQSQSQSYSYQEPSRHHKSREMVSEETSYEETRYEQPAYEERHEEERPHHSIDDSRWT